MTGDADDPLLSRMRKTKDARFSAAKRLRAKADARGSAIVVLSVFAITASLAPIAMKGLTALDETVALMSSLVASLFIFGIAARDKSPSEAIAAHVLRINARALNALCQEYELALRTDSPAYPDQEAMRGRYQLLIDSCAFSHEDLDYDVRGWQRRLAVWLDVHLFSVVAWFVSLAIPLGYVLFWRS